MPQGERFSLLSFGLLRSAPARRSPRDSLATPCGAARMMSSLPWSKESVLPLAIAVEVPVIAVGTTQLPLEELLSFGRSLLL